MIGIPATWQINITRNPLQKKTVHRILHACVARDNISANGIWFLLAATFVGLKPAGGGQAETESSAQRGNDSPESRPGIQAHEQ
jgi:hypothetical protein